jgi:transglutaminase-like putative cysteine protease
MIKPYLNILIMLFFSWSVYAFCQHDVLLPVVGGTVMVLALLLRLKTAEKQFAVFEQIPLSVIIIASFLFGLFWRNIVPIPDDAVSPYPEYAAALQSGSVLAGVLFWLRPLTKNNLSRLVFCAWLTVALSMNVPFNEERLMIFSAFCFVSIAVVIFNTMKKPLDKKYRFVYVRDYIIFSTLLIMMTTVLFLGISSSVVAFEQAFMKTMSGFIMPRQYTNFLRISSKLNLISPGMSAFDRRPVLEISIPDIPGAYLKLQVFDRYENGTWNEPKNVAKRILPTELFPDQLKGKVTLFAEFQNIVPVPAGVTAVKAKLPYLLSRDQILSGQEQQRTRILEFSQISDEAVAQPLALSSEEYEKYTALPASIAQPLKDIATSVTGGEGNLKEKANKLVKYFHQNFSYSLDVAFSADDAGVLKMLREKRPAYCTYFASALALLLRAEGIPARVGAGFVTSERIDRRNNTFLARVNNAHAWTEVFSDGAWRILDPTPPSFSAELKKSSEINLERVFEKMWLNILRFNALIENMDKDKLKLYMVLGLLTVMAYLNRQKIMAALTPWLKDERKAKKIRYQPPDMLHAFYRRYEHYLKEEYGETRGLAETDCEVIARIKERKVPVDRLEHFVKEFHAARFGTQAPEKIKELVEQFKK